MAEQPMRDPVIAVDGVQARYTINGWTSDDADLAERCIIAQRLWEVTDVFTPSPLWLPAMIEAVAEALGGVVVRLDPLPSDPNVIY